MSESKSKDEYQMHFFSTQLTYFKVCKDVHVEDDHLKIPSVFFGVSDSRPKLDPSSLTESYKWTHPAVGMAVPCLKHSQEQGFPSHWLYFKRPSGTQNMSQMCWADQSRQNSLDCSLTHHWICWIFYWGVIGNVSLNTVIHLKKCQMGLRYSSLGNTNSHHLLKIIISLIIWSSLRPEVTSKYDEIRLKGIPK